MAPVGKKPIITLLTDFGMQDHFVGTMKGVIAGISPEAMVIDITHNITPHDIFQAAFLLKNYYSYFPSNAVHLAVVDPGVGSNRKAIVASSEKGYFVAPDNGILSYIYAEGLVSEVREITADHYFLKPRTGTFDGRDVFAPVAAWLTKGVSPSSFGEVLTDYRKYELPQPTPVNPGEWQCRIVYIDRFGNLVSNLTRDKFKECLDSSEKRRFVFQVGEQTITKISNSYAEGEKGELLAIFGSSGFIELSVNRGSAVKLSTMGVGKDFLFKVM
jgi:S-adenosyl-L-methionine hydrolase (adenosine-forming)